MTEQIVTDDEAVQAMNTLCEYVAQNLPIDWVIELTMSRDFGGTWLRLYNEEGDDTTPMVPACDNELADMCEYAKDNPND